MFRLIWAAGNRTSQLLRYAPANRLMRVLRLAVLVFAWNGLKFVLAGPGLVLMRLTSNRRNRPRAHG